AQNLAPDTGWVRHRPQKIERGRNPELAPGRPGMSHRGVKARRETKPDAGVLQTAAHRLRTEIDDNAEGLEHIRRAAGRRGGAGGGGGGGLAVLPRGAPGPRHDERGHRRDVDGMAAVAAGTARVDETVG